MLPPKKFSPQNLWLKQKISGGQREEYFYKLTAGDILSRHSGGFSTDSGCWLVQIPKIFTVQLSDCVCGLSTTKVASLLDHSHNVHQSVARKEEQN